MKIIIGIFIGLVGGCLLAFAIPLGISLLVEADKTPWKIVLAVFAFIGGTYFTAHGTKMFLDAKLASFDRRSEDVRVHAVIISGGFSVLEDRAARQGVRRVVS